MSADQIEFRRGGGCLMLFGLPFLAIGLFAVISPHFGVEWKDDSGQPASLLSITIIGSVFAAVGAAIMFARSGVRIDRLDKQVTSWWGILVPFRTTHRELSDFSLVSLSSETRSSGNSGSSTTVYPVKLVCEGGDDLTVTEVGQNQKTGRRQAERVANFLGFGLRDETGGSTLVREAGTLDESIRTLLLKDPPADPGPHPAGLDVRREGSTAIVEVPAVGLTPPHMIMAVIGASFSLLPAFFLWPMFSDVVAGTEPFHPGHIVFGLFGSLFVIFPLGGSAALLLSAFVFETIKVSSEGVVQIRTGRYRIREATLSFDEAEEIETAKAGRPGANPVNAIGDSRSVRVRSDDKTLFLGRGLEDSGKAWLHELIRCQATGHMPESLQ